METSLTQAEPTAERVVRSAKRIWLLLFSTTLIMTTVIVGYDRIPLGIPGEWEWWRLPLPATPIEAFDRLMPPLIAGSLLLAISFAGAKRIDKSGRIGLLLWLMLLFVGTFAWQRAVQSAAGSPAADAKSLWVLYYPNSSGYFFEATYRIESQTQLLSSYEQRMQKGDVLHEGTHPPGLYILSWWCLKLTENNPRITTMLKDVWSGQSINAFRDLETYQRDVPRLTGNQLGALQLLVLVTAAAGAACVLPVFGAAVSLLDRRHAWYVACLSATIPAICVFFPKSDTIFATSSATVIWLTVLTVSGRGIGRWLAVTAAAGVLFVSLMLSLAHIAIALVCVLYLALNLFRFAPDQAARPPQRPKWQHLVLTAIAGVALFVGLTFLWSSLTDCPIWNIWRMNLKNHAGFYAGSPRTYWKWLLVNPVESAMAFGPMCLIASALMGWRSCGSVLMAARQRNFVNVSPADILSAAFWLTWLLLLLSGKNMGEAARLWCFLLPTATLCAGRWLQLQPEVDRGALWRWMLILQVITAIIIVGRVTGFQELVAGT